MQADNDEFWKRTSQRAALEEARRDNKELHSRGWRRNTLVFIILALAVGAVWLLRR